MTGKIVQIIGIVATIMGMGASLMTEWANEKKMEEMIDEKVNEALTKREENEDE